MEFWIDKLAMTKTNDEFFDAMRRQQRLDLTSATQMGGVLLQSLPRQSKMN